MNKYCEVGDDVNCEGTFYLRDTSQQFLITGCPSLSFRAVGNMIDELSWSFSARPLGGGMPVKIEIEVKKR